MDVTVKQITPLELAQARYWFLTLHRLLEQRKERELERRSQSPHAFLRLQAD
jgi:hypothetical protein